MAFSAKSSFVKDGDLLDYIPGAAAQAGDLVYRGAIAGQVVCSVAAGERGALRVSGVVRVPKASATVFSVANGDKVYYDTATFLAVTDNTKKLTGTAVGGGANGDLYVDVLLNR